MSTKRIEELNRMLAQNNVRSAQVAEKLHADLQAEWSKLFARDKTLERALTALDSASEYAMDEHGEIYRWYRWSALADIPHDAREYFEAYVQDQACATIDWDNECLQAHEGESIVIQDEHGRDNGVWLASKCIIDESSYRDEAGEVDEAKRNALIEAHMKRSGYFPGVFRITQHGDVYFVNTQAKKE